MKMRANPITSVFTNSVLFVVAIIILGASVASCRDKSSGAGSDDLKISQTQKEQKPGSSGTGQGKQPEKSDTKTASGGQETEGRTVYSGSGEEKTSGTGQQQTGDSADQGKADSKVAGKQGDSKESKDASSQTEAGAGTQEKGKETGGQTASSGSGKESVSGTEQEGSSQELKDKLTQVSQKGKHVDKITRPDEDDKGVDGKGASSQAEAGTDTTEKGQETGGQTASSGSGEESTSETGQQGSGQDTNDQLAQGKQQAGDASGTGRTDSKQTPARAGSDGDSAGQTAQQEGQESQSGQGDSQKTDSTEVAFAGDPKLHIGVEIFTANPKIITVENAGKIDNSGVSNTGIQKQLNASNNTAAQNSNTIKKMKLKVPSSKASKALRETECAYLAVRLKHLLNDIGNYGMVHVVPAAKVKGENVALSSSAFDYIIRAEILRSDGYGVELRVRFYSSINGFKKHFLRFTISDDIAKSAYAGKKSTTTTGKTILELDGDPYDSVLRKIVSILNKTYREKRTIYPDKRHRELTLTRYGHEVLPDAFKDYPITEQNKRYVVDPAPDPANPYVGEVIMWKLHELEAIEKFEEHYKKAANDVEGPYHLWRRGTREALIAYIDLKKEIKKVKSKALTQLVAKRTMKVIPALLGYLVGGDSVGAKEGVGLLLLTEAVKLLGESMTEKNGYITVPKFGNLIVNNGLDKMAYQIEGYNEQLVDQAVAVESLKEEFSTLTEPIILDLGSNSKTYYGKIDEVFRQFKGDLRKEYYEETGFAYDNKDINDELPKTADNEDKDDDKDKDINGKLVKTADKEEDDDDEGGWDEL